MERLTEAEVSMTEQEARKILINKSLTGAFTNEECDALSVLFREVEQLNKWKAEFIEQLCTYDGNSLDEIVQKAQDKVVGQFRLKSYEWNNENAVQVPYKFIEWVAEQMKAGDKNE